MAKRRTPDFLNNRSRIKEQIIAQDRQAVTRREEERGSLSTLPLERIQQRATDTRPLNEKHIGSLMESIAILGLIEPLAVDQDRVLLAGGHRLAAIFQLRKIDSDSFNQQFPDSKIPVRIMPFKAASSPEKALQVEVAENEHRRDYTPSEVKGLAARLRDAGYKHSRGRPKAGERSLMPALSVVVGKNIRTIQRYLKEDTTTENTTDVAYYLRKASKALKTWEKNAKKNSQTKELMAQLPGILELIESTEKSTNITQ